MPLEIMTTKSPDNPFEAAVLRELARCPLDGVATGNVLIPHIKMRSLPNEQDVLVLTRGRVYTLDAKHLLPGAYRGTGESWEYRPVGEDWSPCTFMTHPLTIAFKKQRAVEAFLRERLARDGTAGVNLPDVIGGIVVPDHADVSGLGWREDGSSPLGARLLLCNLSALPEILAADYAAHNRRSPSVEELRVAFGVGQSRPVQALPCNLTDNLSLEAFVARLSRPVTRWLYRGYNSSTRRAVRVEILPKYDPTADRADDADRLRRGFRNNVLALSDLRHDAVLKLYNHYDTPMSLVVVSEWFGERTLQDVLVDERTLSWARTREVFRPVVDLLTRAHAGREPIVHRYLDPGSILVAGEATGPWEVRVQGFFGAVVGPQSTTGPDGDDGNPYLDPDRADDDHRRTPLQDAYSVGRCIAASLTGSPHWLPEPPDVSPALAGVIANLTGRDHGERAAAWARLPACLAAD